MTEKHTHLRIKFVGQPMRRRTFLTACGTVPLAGCIGSFASGDEGPNPGTVTCADDLAASSSNDPADGSWPTDLHDMRNTGQTDAAGPSGCVKTRWTWSQKPQAGMTAGPAVGNERLYAPAQEQDDTSVVVFDADTGDRQSEIVDERYSIDPTQTPTLVEDTLFLVDGTRAAAIDLQKQTTRWHRDLQDQWSKEHFLEPPRIANGLVYLGGDAGVVHALDAETGHRRWTYDIDGLSTDEMPDVSQEELSDERRRGAIYAPLAATSQRVYVTSWGFSLYALDAATGERLWEFSPGSNHLDMMNAPVIVDGTVFTQTSSAVLYVLDAETGEQLWMFDELGVSAEGISPLVDDDTVYITAGTSTENLFLVALDRDEQSVRWKRSIGPLFQYPTGDSDTVYLDQGSGLHAIDKANGETKWDFQMKRVLAAPVAVAGEAVYLADEAHVYGIW